LAGIRALELARAGSEVILAARSETKGRDAVDRIRRQLPPARVRFETLDLASLRSVQAFAAKVNREAKLNLLVNNAGVMAVPKRQVTKDGFELQFGTNFLGPFALTALLMPALERSGSPRVTTVSSGAANMGLIIQGMRGRICRPAGRAGRRIGWRRFSRR